MYYSPQEATNEIRRRLRDGGAIIFTYHAEDEMEDDFIDDQEITAAIRSGSVREKGREESGEFTYKIETKLNGGIAVVVAIPDDDPNVIVVTTFRQLGKKLKKVRR